jgi:AcrR family transcriptional regulator
MRPPQQERSRRTLDRIVAAALEVVAEKGVEGAAVQEIVDRAGSSVGSFYARFDGKDDLVRFLQRRVWADATRRWDEGIAAGAWDDGRLGTVVEGLVALLVRVERADVGRRAALAGVDPGAAASGPTGGGADGAPATAAAFRERIAEDVRALLLDRRDEIAHPDPERAVDTLLRVLVGAARELREGAEEPEVTRELVRMALGYLVSPGTETPPDRTTVDFFDVWG